MISVKNLCFSYTGDQNFAVKEVSFEIGDGEIFGFLGPNGAGKTTTQKVLTGLLPLQKGQVVINGMDIKKGGKKLFDEIGVSFEHPNLYKKLTGYENLEFYSKMFDKPTQNIEKLLKMVGLDEAQDKKVEDYSKGMQQRLVFARSLINNPRIWFLDEPTAGLDPHHARDVKDIIIEKKHQGTTIFLTTHNMTIAEELCDRVGLINQGEIVTIDTPRNLKLKHGEKMVKVEYKDNGVLKRKSLSLEKPHEKKQLQKLLELGTIETIHTQEATLETVFIKLTGRGLHGNAV